MAEYDFIKIQKKLSKYLDENRFHHTLGVMYTCAALAMACLLYTSSLESQEPVRDFDFLGITQGYEMCYTNVLQLLDLSQIPFLAKERGEEFPLVIGGGACAYNPEPLAEFFDLFYIGEGETAYDALFDAYIANKKAGGTKKDFLLKAAQIPGIYVPAFYDVTYQEDGTIASFTPNQPEAPSKVEKQLVDVYKRQR